MSYEIPSEAVEVADEYLKIIRQSYVCEDDIENAITRLIDKGLIPPAVFINLFIKLQLIDPCRVEICTNIVQKINRKYQISVFYENAGYMLDLLIRNGLVDNKYAKFDIVSKIIEMSKNYSPIRKDESENLEQLKNYNYPIRTIDYSAICGSFNCYKKAKIYESPTQETFELSFFGGNKDIIADLQNKFTINKTCLEYAIIAHNNDLIDLIVTKARLAPMFKQCLQYFNFELLFQKLNRVKNINFVDKENDTVLTACADLGLDFLIKYFVKIGADVNFCPPNGNSPLARAVGSLRCSTFDLLIELGADIDFIDRDGVSKIFMQKIMEASLFDNESFKKYFNLDKLKYDNSDGWIADKHRILFSQEKHQQCIAVRSKDKKFNGAELFTHFNSQSLKNFIDKIEIDDYSSALFAAIDTTDQNKVRIIVDHIVKIGRKDLLNKKDKDGNPPINLAIMRSMKFSAIHLIENGCEVNITGETTPMILSVLYNEVEIFNKLIEKNVKITQKILFCIISSKRIEMLSSLIDSNYKFDADLPILNAPILMGKLDLVKKLVEKKKIEINSVNGENPLFMAINMNNFEIAKYLIDNGADIEAKGTELDTPVMRCCQFNADKILEYLIDKGAKLNVRSQNGLTPLFCCALSNSYKCISVLAKTNQLVIDEKWPGDSITPFQIACSKNHIGATKEFLRNGANINNKDKFGSTALIDAAKMKNCELCKWLISKGANVNIKDNGGKTALAYFKFDSQSNDIHEIDDSNEMGDEPVFHLPTFFEPPEGPKPQQIYSPSLFEEKT